MVSLTVWSLAVGLVFVSRPLGLKLLWFPPFLTATVYLVVGWFLFALSYTGNFDRLPTTVVWALVLLPVPYFFLTATNHLHGLVLVNPEVVTSNGVARLQYDWGPAVWAYVGYTYVLAALAAGLLFRKSLRTANVYRKLSFTVFAGGLSLWCANIVTFAGLSPFPHMLLTPFVFLFWGVIGLAVFASSRFVRVLPLDAVFSTFGSRFNGAIGLGRDFVIEEMDSGVLILDTDGRLVDVNTMAKRMLGTRRRLLGKQVREVIDLEPYFDDPNDLRSDTDRHDVIQVTAHDGTERYYDIDTTVLNDENEGIIGQAVLMNDVTERHRATDYRHRLYETLSNPELTTEDRLNQLLALGCDCLDVETGFLTQTANGTQRVIEACGPSAGVHMDSDHPLAESYCQQVIDRDEPLIVRHASESDLIVDAARERFAFETYIGSRLIVNGELYGTVCFVDRLPHEREYSTVEMALFDLIVRAAESEVARRRYEQRLERQNERLEQFSSVLSHDLRNPLGVAVGYLEIVAEATDEADSVAKIENAHDRMERIIEDVLTVARQGRAIEETSSIALAPIVGRAWENVETNDIELLLDVDEKQHDGDQALGTIEADAGRAERLFENLFRNAVEHGQEATLVRVGRWSGGFYVEDDGPGIPAEQREAVFDHGHTTSESGTGFGLSIVEQIAEAHGWEIIAAEGTEKGARFEVSI